MGLDWCNGRREVLEIETELGLNLQTGRPVVGDTELPVIANKSAHSPRSTRFRLRAWRRGKGLREPGRSVDGGFDEAHFADLPVTKIVKIEGDTPAREREEGCTVLPRLQCDGFRRQAIREADLELADVDGRSWERSFQRPFCESRQLPRRVVEARSQNRCRGKKYNQEDAQPPARAPRGRLTAG